MESLTKKEKIAQHLLSKNKWMTGVEIAEGIGIAKELVHSAMSSVMREKRFTSESKFEPRDGTKGHAEVKMYRITAIEPKKTKEVRSAEREQKREEATQICWITDPVLVRQRMRECLFASSGASL
jgi:hypothetical protein